MKLVGTCHLCGGPAMNTCFFCGKLVCRRCYDPAHGACRSCGIKKGLIQEEDLTGEGAEEFGEEY